MADDPPAAAPPSLAAAALGGLCPRCGARTLFGRGTGFAERCRACGLEFARFNVGDGPAAFLSPIIGALVGGLALWLEVALSPPVWVHLLLWLPLAAAAVWFGLRVSKAALLWSEYSRGASGT